MKNKRTLIILLLVFVTPLLKAQNLTAHFYYYQGEKIYLELNTESVYISSTQKDIIAETNFKSQMSNVKSVSPVKEDHTAKSLLKPENFNVIHPERYWSELKLKNTNKSNKQKHLNQLATLKAENKKLIVAPFFTSKNGVRISLTPHFYVKLKHQDDFKVLLNLVKKYQLELVGYNELMPLWFVVSVTPDTKNTIEMANVFYETGMFTHAQPEFLYFDLLQNSVKEYGISNTSSDMVATPRDNLYASQWVLNNTGQSGGIPGIDIKAEAAWDITLGSPNVKVAVIDTGIGLNHEDLNDYLDAEDSYDAILNRPGSRQIYGSHGTAVAGIIGANDNEKGVRGVAPNTSLMSISLLRDSEANHTTTTDVLRSFRWAINNGAHIINNSWSLNFQDIMIGNVINMALTEGRDGKGIVVVFASGNDNTIIDYPANSNSKILVVGAINRCGQRSVRDSINPNICDPWGIGLIGSNYGSSLDLVAGGTSIVTTSIDFNSTSRLITDYTSAYDNNFNGTSAAAPYVAGVAALILSVNPGLSAQEVNDIIEQSAQKISPRLYMYSDRPNGSWNDEVGYGLVNAYEAVLMAQNSLCGDVTITSPVNSGQTDTLGANTIIARNKIENGGIAQYSASTAVFLKRRFHAKKGSNFHAFIENCNPLERVQSQVPKQQYISYKVENIPVPTTVDINLYPNPVKSLLNITSSEAIIALKLTNVYGQNPLTNIKIDDTASRKTTIDFSDLLPGIYFVKISLANGETIIKHIMKK